MASKRLWLVVVLLSVGGTACGSGATKDRAGPDAGAAGSGGSAATFPPDPDPPQVVYDGGVAVAPGAVLFTGAGQTAQLSARAFDAAGKPVAGTVTWTSSRPEEITVDDRGVVTSRVAVGSAQITATIGDRVSDPIAVLAVEAYPDTTLVSDAQIVSGPSPVDEAAPVAPGSRLRATLSGVAAPAVGSLLVASEGKPLAGRVVAVTASGSDLVVELEVVPLLDLFAKMNIHLDSTIDERALVALEAAGKRPVDSDAEYGFAQDGLQLSGWECSLSGGGANVGAYGLSIDSNVRIVPSIDVQSAFEKDTEGDWALISVDLQGSVTATGRLSLKFAPAAQVEATCTATLQHFDLPIGGPLGLVASFAVPVGLVGKVKASIGTIPFELGVEAKLSGTIHDMFVYTPTTGMTYLRDSGIDFGGKAIHNLPVTTLPFSVKLDVSAGVFAGLDLRLLAWYQGLLRADFLGKFSADLALEDTQLDLPAYASKYEVVPSIEIGPGKQVADALKYFGDRIRLQPRIVLDFPDQGSRSPLGTLSADKTSIGPGDTVELTLTLDPKTLEFAHIDNVELVKLYRETTGSKRQLVEAEAATPGKRTYTWKWTAAPNDVGPARFWAATETKLGPHLPLEVAPDSKLTIQVGGRGWYGTVKYTVSGERTDVDEGASETGSHRSVDTYEVSAKGTIDLGPADMGADFGAMKVTGGSVTWTETHTEDDTSTTKDLHDCTVVSSSHGEWITTGTVPASEGYPLLVVAGDQGTVGLATISGEIPWTYERHGTISRSGNETCMNSTDGFMNEGTSSVPGEVLQLQGPVDPMHPDSFQGSTKIEFDRFVPLTYDITWNFERR